MMNTKKLMKRLATGLLGASLTFGASHPSQSHASTIEEEQVKNKIFDDSVIFNINQHIVDNYKPIDYFDIYNCSNHLDCKYIRDAGKLIHYIGITLSSNNFDVDNYSEFHDSLLLFLDKYYKTYIDLSGLPYKELKDDLENWSLDSNGVMVDQSDRHKKIFNYLLLKLYFMSSPKYFYKDLNMKEWDRDFVSNHYKSTSFYINTHIDRDADGHFDEGYIQALLNASGGESKKQKEIEAGPMVPVPLHEPLALYNVHRAGRPFLGLNRKHHPMESQNWDIRFKVTGDNKQNALHAIEHMLQYNNSDIEKQQFKIDSQNLFSLSPVSIMELFEKGVNPLDGKGIPAWGDLKINNLVFPAFLNIGLGSNVEVSGNMLLVFPSQATNKVIAPDNGVITVRGLNNEKPINIIKRYVQQCAVVYPSAMFTRYNISNQELFKKSNIFLIDNLYPCSP